MKKKRNIVAYSMIVERIGKAGPHKDKRKKREKNAKRSWHNDY